MIFGSRHFAGGAAGIAALLAVFSLPSHAFAQAAVFPTTSNSSVSGPKSPMTDFEGNTNDVGDDENRDTRARTPQDDRDIEAKAAKAKAKTKTTEREPAPEAELAAPPNAPIVRGLEVVGASPEDTKKALRALQTKEGEPLNPTKQRDDIRRLYDLGLFKPNINVEADEVKDGVKLRYDVDPNLKVGEISVSGNSQVPTNKILSELPVKAGEVYTIQAQNKIRETIARYYEDKGFNEAVVNVEERPAANNGVNLAIAVDEGTKMKIHDLIIHGNNSIGSLPVKLRTQNKGSWGPFTHYYNEAKFQDDLEAIKALYISRGFLDVDIRRGDFVYATDQSWVSPVIEITEGPRYKVGRLDARGYSVFSQDEVMAPFRGLQGQYYNLSKFNSGAEKIKNMYGDEGFLLCRVEPDFHKDPARAMVDVDIDVAEGQRIYVGDVKILAQNYPDDTEMGWLRRYYARFSPPVKDEVVQREVRLHPGQVYRRFDEVKTRENLKSLNVFEDVKVHDQLSAAPNVRDCVVECSQGNTGNLIFGVGFGDVEGAFVYANYIEHNLFGMAKDLRVSGVIGTRAQNYDVTFLDRYFMGRDVAAQFNAFHHSVLETGDFRQMNTGMTAEFTRTLSDCVKDAIRVRLEEVSFKFDGDKPVHEFDDYLAATVRYRINHDTRDDTFFPTTGHVLGGSVEAGEADGFLLKFEGQYSSYHQLCDGWVFASNSLVGLLPYNSENIGYADRFFLGGSQDMRGFKLSGAGPHDRNNNDIPLGGATKTLSQYELRRSFTDNLVGLAFMDVGTLDEKALSLGTPRVSVGVGARLRLPIAKVSVDLGVPLAKQSRDQTQILHFNLTSSF